MAQLCNWESGTGRRDASGRGGDTKKDEKKNKYKHKKKKKYNLNTTILIVPVTFIINYYYTCYCPRVFVYLFFFSASDPDGSFFESIGRKNGYKCDLYCIDDDDVDERRLLLRKQLNGYLIIIIFDRVPTRQSRPSDCLILLLLLFHSDLLQLLV